MNEIRASRGRWRRAAALLAAAALACAATACSTDDTGSDGDASDAPSTTTVDFVTPAEATFTERPCDPAPSVPERVTCGDLEVPEQHAQPDGRMIRVAVDIVEPESKPTGSEPVVFLNGGPGFGGISILEGVLTNPPVQRTIVLVDYRGTGASDPSLACPENDHLDIPNLALPSGDEGQREKYRAALEACRDRLVGDGIDIAAYNYENIAADLDSLRVALGYDSWDLWGLSNGGRVALEVARRYPDGVHALVLDAAAPPQANLLGDLWVNGAAAIDRLFDACAADDACSAAYPDLEADFEASVERFGDEPVTVESPASDDAPSVPVLFSDVLPLNALRNALYDTGLIPLLPYYLDEIANGRSLAVVAGLIVGRTGSDGYSDGMALTVNCREELSFLPDGHFEKQAEALPLYKPVIDPLAADDCDLWDVGTAPAVLNEPVTSDIPTLLLVGELDPVHPRANAQAIADGLSRSTVVELPGLGHGTVFNECADELMAAFLDAPTEPVDTACVEAMPAPAWLVAPQ